ncbi:glutathione S-transferase C-terminal domain-containing protein [Halomonas organivorans]
MGMLKNGSWRVDYQRPHGIHSDEGFRGCIRVDSTHGRHPELDRYHLYISYACPWAHRTLIARALRGLENAISITVVDPILTKQGWKIPEGNDPVLGARYLHQVYTAAAPQYTGRVTVPVLWDKKHNEIVSTESADIMWMLATQFERFAQRKADLYPQSLCRQIDHWSRFINSHVNAAVYRVGFAHDYETHHREKVSFFQALERLDRLLDHKSYLASSSPTAADWRLFCTLVRLDIAYAPYLGCNLARLADFPNLSAHTNRLMQFRGVAETISKEHIQRHFEARAKELNLGWRQAG